MGFSLINKFIRIIYAFLFVTFFAFMARLDTYFFHELWLNTELHKRIKVNTHSEPYLGLKLRIM